MPTSLRWVSTDRRSTGRPRPRPRDLRSDRHDSASALATDVGRLIRWDRIVSDTGASSTVALPTRRRGVFTIGPLRLWVHDPFALFGLTVAVARPVTLVVHPSVVAGMASPAVRPGSSGSRQFSDGSLGARTDDPGGEWTGLRPYAPGDRLHLLSWQAEARFGALLVHDFRPDSEDVVTILFDDRAGVHRRPAFEKALGAVIGLVSAAEGPATDYDVSTLSGRRVRGSTTPDGLVALLTVLAETQPTRSSNHAASLAPEGCTTDHHTHCGADLAVVARSRFSRGGRVMRGLRRLGPDAFLLVASVIAAAAVGRLFQGGLGGRASGALLVAAAVGSAVPALLALKRVPAPIRAVVSTIAVILTSLWTTIGVATTFGLPTAHTWHVAQSDLRAARPLLDQLVVPLRPAPGLVFLAAMTCGVVAMLASVLLHASDTRGRVYPGIALLCPLGLLSFACSQSTPGTMVVLVMLFVAAGAMTLATARSDSVRQARPPATHRRSWITPTAVTACTMAGVVLAAVLVNANAQGAGPGPGVAPAVPLSAESLTSNLLAVEVHDANDVLFQAHSGYRTYWQVAVLNVLRNGVWVPDPVTESAAHGATNRAPVTQSQGGAGSVGRSRDDKAAVQIDDLTSRILPVPPGTIALSGTAATLTGVGAVSPTPTTSGQQYTTLSTPPVTDPGSLGGNAPVTTYPPALMQADTALPALPASIEALAHAVTAGAPGPLAQAELLVNWFRSGQFHYTLDPPASPPGTDPLVSFLTQTHSGSCEQFAGAFVVLARSLGLPGRVVVGFTAGRYGGPGEVTVRGADAHVWAQVYLGPRAGWVSFEPTPQQPRGDVAPDGVIGPSGVSTTTPTTAVRSPTTTPPPTAPLTAPTTVPTVPIRSGSNTFSPTPMPGSALGAVWWTLIGATAVLVFVLVLVLLIRRRRRWSPAGRTPEQLVLLSQAEVDRALRHAGIERPLWQPMELLFENLNPPGTDRLDTDPAATSPGSYPTAWLVEDGVTVAQAADAVLFDPLDTSDERSRSAYQAALRVLKGLSSLQLTTRHRRSQMASHGPPRID